MGQIINKYPVLVFHVMLDIINQLLYVCEQYVYVINVCLKESLVISTITKDLELKETRQELETHRQEHSDQQQVSYFYSLFLSQH